MKRWRYALDPLCVAACAAYAINRWLVPPSVKGPFFRNHFNDLLLIPAALPLVLWLYRQLKLRAHDDWPRWSEIVSHVVIWSVAAEWVGPHLFSRATGDLRDVFAYAAGGVMAGVAWMYEL
ncbi:MAG: hypothetical protein QM790_17590 [Nibricoccus sp.]